MSVDKPKSIVQQYVQEQVAKEMEPFYQAFGRVTDKKPVSADKSKASVLVEELAAQATWVPSGPAGVMHRSAAELRRLEASEAALIEALKNVTAHLIAAHSLLQRGGKKAAASDKIFNIMLADYEKSFEVGRTAIARAKEARRA